MIYIYIFINIYLCIFHIRTPHIKSHSNFVHLKLTCPYSRKSLRSEWRIDISRIESRQKKNRLSFIVYLFSSEDTQNQRAAEKTRVHLHQR